MEGHLVLGPWGGADPASALGGQELGAPGEHLDSNLCCFVEGMDDMVEHPQSVFSGGIHSVMGTVVRFVGNTAEGGSVVHLGEDIAEGGIVVHLAEDIAVHLAEDIVVHLAEDIAVHLAEDIAVHLAADIAVHSAEV